VATLVLAASSFAGCGNVTVLTVSHAGDTDGVTATSIRVGALGSFSGFAASSFAPVTTGAAVYFDQLNASGGVYGRKIVYAPIVDDGTSPSGNTAGA
jgi:ABC-type branched-subunit amino acid transport system substrate-binding protein